ncbi:MAG: hypothetical protein Q8N31_02370 [Reyranella sp.]|nr:hypothetical protein [Reyranella sp.]
MKSYSLNLLHILLLLSAVGCFYFASQEAPRRTIKFGRMLRSPAFALLAALLLTFFQVGMKQPIWPPLAALTLGLAAGATRGFTMKLAIDEYWLVVRPGPRRPLLVWVAALLVLAVAVDIAGALVGPAMGRDWRFGAALVAAGCAGFLLGRGLALMTRVWRFSR